ncbi:hypothetical protein KFL_001310060 [Klebsormidium nitens]|uniref:Uncharacterized protein n=1 Tax=Klebsormidium nitens TaxID=105231 RepID=A0A1Y1HWF3_KLENI|nr:hypothetical protein KFL_001310060 [Klebsormidium nitens]|eukprot:GAQ82974.1 hypothetical protein KFL_001310060 [Klebsormidium nitens]
MATASFLKNTQLSGASPCQKVVASLGGAFLDRTGLAGHSSKLRCANSTSLECLAPTSTISKRCGLVDIFRQGTRTDFRGVPGVAVLSCKGTGSSQWHAESDACKKASQRPVVTASASQRGWLERAEAGDAEKLIEDQEERENTRKAASAIDFTDKKLCTDCGVRKPLRNFEKLVTSADGRHLSCRACRACLAKRRAQEQGRNITETLVERGMSQSSSSGIASKSGTLRRPALCYMVRCRHTYIWIESVDGRIASRIWGKPLGRRQAVQRMPESAVKLFEGVSGEALETGHKAECRKEAQSAAPERS